MVSTGFTNTSTVSPMPTGIINVLAKHLYNVLNSDKPIPDEKEKPLIFPMPIKLLRKILTPNEKEKRPPAVVNHELVVIENHLKLDTEKRQLLRKLLFPSSYPELHDMDIANNLSIQ